MTVTSYDGDPRVEKVNDYFYVVDDDDKYDVSADYSSTDRGKLEWSISHAIGSRAMRDANLRSREEAEGWAKADYRGPFPSAEIALYELLGPPR
jgi:hypothetical protein